MLKFITSDASTLGQKRKVSPRACELCRKRKRRCDHTETLRTSTTLNASMKQTLPAHQPPRASPKHASTADASPGASGKDHNEAPGSKFRRSPANPADVMHPATANVTIQNTAPAFHQAIHGSHEEGSDEADGDSVMLGSRFIGDLNPEGMFLAATSPNKTTTNGVNQMDSIGIWLAEKLSKRDAHKSRLVPDSSESNPFYNFSPFFQKVLFPMLAEECLSTLPPPSELEFLSSIYFEKHHPIFPVIDADAFRALDHLDPAKILLKQGICLVASMDPTSRTHLRLPNTLSTLGPRDFGRRVSSAMRISIETGLVTQNVVLTQAFALLSGFIEGPSGRDVSSQLCGRAVHCLHSAGLHLESTRQSHSSQYAETLTCCIWALDRLNAAFHGRPVLMHERDIGRNLESCFRRQKPCFQLFLRLILLLDKAIDLYRPRSDKSIGWTGDFPLFEELLVNSDECHIPTPLLATTEILYHAVAILSCRSTSFEHSQRLPTSYNRQSLSAAQIAIIVDQEPREYLSWFPFVPYAVSLALSVAYREMRYHRLPMYRARARSQLVNNCKILKEVGEYFWSASMMAEMGELTLREMEKVFSKVASSRQQRRELGSSSRPVTIEAGPEGNGTVPNTINGTPGYRRLLSEIPQLTKRIDDLQNDPGISDHVNADQEYTIDQPLPADMLDFDIFAMFDPSVDLDGIDACLAGNFDMSFPNAFQ